MISSIEDFNIEDYEYDYKRGFSDSRPIGGMYISGNLPLEQKTIRKGDSVKVLIKQLYTFDDTSTETIINNVFDSGSLYYI